MCKILVLRGLHFYNVKDFKKAIFALHVNFWNKGIGTDNLRFANFIADTGV